MNLEQEHQIIFGPFHLDLATNQLWRGERTVTLQPKPLAVLRYLAERPGQVVTRQELLKVIWAGMYVSKAVLKTCVQVIRKALGDDATAPRYIETVGREGYRFIEQGQGSPFKIQESTSELPASFQPPASIVVGREYELGQLQHYFECAARGERQVVFVTGEPGVGKTALVRAFLVDRGTADDLLIAQGHCVEHYGAGEAYLPVLAAIEALCRTSVGRQLLPLLRQHAPLWLAQLPSWINPAEREELQRQLAGTSPQRMLREIANCLTALTATRTLVLVLEDLHWSDYSTVTLLAYLARWPQRLRLLVLGTYRPVEVLTQNHPLRTVQQELMGQGFCVELPLPLLTEAAIEEYLQRRLSHTAWPTRLARALYRRTEGNPLFMVAMIEELIVQGLIATEDGSGLSELPLQEATRGVPERLRQLITVQMERLRGREQRLLEAASVAGLEFSVAEVTAVIGGNEVAVEERCESLTRRQQFLRPAGVSEWPDGTVAARYGFLHALYQYLWQERVKAGRWRRWHQQMGERKETGYGAYAKDIAAELAMHFEQGRDYQRAVRYWQFAGENAVTKNAFHEAVDHFTKGVALIKTLPDSPETRRQELLLVTALGPSLAATKGIAAQEAAQAYRRAEELCQQLGDTPQLFPALWGLSTFYMGRGDLRTPVKLAQRLLKLAEGTQDSALLLQAHLAAGFFFRHAGELPRSRVHLEQAIAIYEVQQLRSLSVRLSYDPGVASLSYLVLTLWYLGYPDLALQKNEQALRLARELSHAHSLAYALTAATWCRLLRREIQATQAQAEELITFTIEQGFPYWLAQGNILWGWAAAQQGNEEGILRMEQNLARWRAIGTEIRPGFLGLMADICWKKQQSLKGLTLVDEALGVVEKSGEYFYEPELHRLKGELLLLLGGKRPRSRALARAEGSFHKAIEVARQQQAKSLELRAVTSLARLWQSQGKKKEARKTLAEISRWFIEGFDTEDLQEAKVLLEALS